MQNFKSHAISALVTFGSVFIPTAVTIISAVPTETWQSPEAYTVSFWGAIIITIFRGLVRPLVAAFVKNYYK